MKKLLTLLAFTFILSFQSFGQQTLCEIYGSTPIFETFDLPVNASSLDFSSFEGKHIQLNSMITVDDDIIFKDCIISIGTSALFQGSLNSSVNKTIQFENCKVYTCNGSYSFLANFQYDSVMLPQKNRQYC